MPEKNNSANEGITQALDLKDIDPSPYQHRRHFDEDKLKELAVSIQREGLIEPIVVRSVGKHYQLIAGERRFRAIRDFTEMETIQAQIVIAGDLQARRISAAENLQREDLSAIETIEAIVEIVDAELIEDKEYASMGKKPADRVKVLLGKLHSITNSKDRGSKVSKENEALLNKFVQQVEKIFKNLPKSLEWRSFFNHDLNLIVETGQEVRDVAIRHKLSKSQARAWARCHVRFVADTDPDVFIPAVREHLDAKGFSMVDITPVPNNYGQATRMDPENPWVKFTTASFEKTLDKKVAFLPNLGGTLPNDAFSHILGMPTIWVPHSYAACSQHAPNEHIIGTIARQGLQLMTGLFWDLAESKGMPIEY